MSNIASKTLRPINIFIAILLGIGVTIYLLHYQLEQKNETLNSLLNELSHPNWFWLILALLVLMIRDSGYMYRIHHLTEKSLDWKSSFRVIMLWEFTSAVTPSAVGGSAVAMFFLNKEGIKMGKSISYVTLTSILDNLFFLVLSPIALFITSTNFDDFGSGSSSIFWVFWTSYGLISLYTGIMSYAIFISPSKFQNFIDWIALKLNIRVNWKIKLHQLSDDIITSSKILKDKPNQYWFKALGSTIFVWLSRYFIVNCLIAAYTDMSLYDHLLVLSKHSVLWVSQLVSPTPGGSGLAEYFFIKLMGVGISVAILWRILTYYSYLLIGSIIFPRWIKKVLVKE